MEKGIPLKEILGPHAVELLAESFAGVVPGFIESRFTEQALSGLDELELTQRARHLGQALAAQLPVDFEESGPLLIRALGPELTATEGNGLATFFYMPHANVIATRGLDNFEQGMQANYELTKRFTAEFSIRPFLERYQAQSLRLLKKWIADPNPHVRRLVSEGTRPRLPWASRWRAVQEQPQLTLPLLEALKDDPVLYVRRSVANHLGDIAKDHPDIVFQLCDRWLKEIAKKSFPADTAANRRWMIRHAVRHPAQREVPAAVELRIRAR